MKFQETETIELKKSTSELKEAVISSWDTEVCDKATFDDIGAGKLTSFLKLSGLKFDTIPNSLEKLNLVQDGNRIQFFQMKIRFTRYWFMQT